MPMVTPSCALFSAISRDTGSRSGAPQRLGDSPLVPADLADDDSACLRICRIKGRGRIGGAFDRSSTAYPYRCPMPRCAADSRTRTTACPNGHQARAPGLSKSLVRKPSFASPGTACRREADHTSPHRERGSRASGVVQACPRWSDESRMRPPRSCIAERSGAPPQQPCLRAVAANRFLAAGKTGTPSFRAHPRGRDAPTIRVPFRAGAGGQSRRVRLSCTDRRRAVDCGFIACRPVSDLQSISAPPRRSSDLAKQKRSTRCGGLPVEHRHGIEACRFPVSRSRDRCPSRR